MFNTTPTDSPRSQASYSSDATVSSSTEEERAPDSTSAPLPTFSTREPASGHHEAATVSAADGAPAEAVHTDPSVQVRAGGGIGHARSARDGDDRRSDDGRSDEKRSDEKSGKEKGPTSTADIEPTGTPKARAPHKQLQRHGHVLNLKERQFHVEFDKRLQKGGGEIDVDVPSAEVMEALISWMKAGPPVKILRLTCDFGGLHFRNITSLDDSEDSGGKQKAGKLDEQLFARLLDTCRGIETIDLSDCKLSPESYRMLRYFLMRKDCELESLLFGGQGMYTKDVMRLARGLQSNASLTELSLCETSISPDNLKRIIDAVILNPRITSLWMENVDACFEVLPALGKLVAAGHCVHLSVSHPEGVRMIGRDVKHWNGLFKGFCAQLLANKSLRLLDLSGFDLTKSNSRDIVHTLKCNAHIEWLVLGKNIPTKEQAGLIQAYLQRNRIANRKALMPYAKAALDLLAGATVSGIWPKELSDLVAAEMVNSTLAQLKQGLEEGFPRPRRWRKLKASSAPASTASTSSTSALRQRSSARAAPPAPGQEKKRQ